MSLDDEQGSKCNDFTLEGHIGTFRLIEQTPVIGGISLDLKPQFDRSFCAGLPRSNQLRLAQAHQLHVRKHKQHIYAPLILQYTTRAEAAPACLPPISYTRYKKQNHRSKTCFTRKRFGFRVSYTIATLSGYRMYQILDYRALPLLLFACQPGASRALHCLASGTSRHLNNLSRV